MSKLPYKVRVETKSAGKTKKTLVASFMHESFALEHADRVREVCERGIGPEYDAFKRVVVSYNGRKVLKTLEVRR